MASRALARWVPDTKYSVCSSGKEREAWVPWEVRKRRERRVAPLEQGRGLTGTTQRGCRGSCCEGEVGGGWRVGKWQGGCSARSMHLQQGQQQGEGAWGRCCEGEVGSGWGSHRHSKGRPAQPGPLQPCYGNICVYSSGSSTPQLTIL